MQYNTTQCNATLRNAMQRNATQRNATQRKHNTTQCWDGENCTSLISKFIFGKGPRMFDLKLFFLLLPNQIHYLILKSEIWHGDQMAQIFFWWVKYIYF